MPGCREIDAVCVLDTRHRIFEQLRNWRQSLGLNSCFAWIDVLRERDHGYDEAILEDILKSVGAVIISPRGNTSARFVSSHNDSAKRGDPTFCRLRQLQSASIDENSRSSIVY